MRLKRPLRLILGGRRIITIQSRDIQVVEVEGTSPSSVTDAFPGAKLDTTAESSPGFMFT